MKVLVCPLNWGLGHATRCIPLVRELVEQGHEVVIATDGFPLQLLRTEFPELRFIHFPSYSIRYSKKSSQVWAMTKSIPVIVSGILKEHFFLKKILCNENFDRVISDNRFGLWNRKTRTTYITHQLMVKMPRMLAFVEPLIWALHRCFIYKYDECLIPDNEGVENLSGDLSHHYPLPRNARFIGILSRFDQYKNAEPDNKYAAVAIISGVEPQRTLFEEMVVKQFANSEKPTLIVMGKPATENSTRTEGNITFVSHIATYELAKILKGTEKIICRSGYSTIMDLATLRCMHKAQFVPTPGQTEQEYLAKYHEM